MKCSIVTLLLGVALLGCGKVDSSKTVEPTAAQTAATDVQQINREVQALEQKISTQDEQAAAEQPTSLPAVTIDSP